MSAVQTAVVEQTAPESTSQNVHDFTWVQTDEPHATRRKQILAKYPQVKELFGSEPLTAYIVVAEFCIQLLMCHIVRDVSWPVFFLLAYVVGGTINHSLELGVHEITHDLSLSTHEANKRLAMFACLPTGFPSAMTFRKYHHEHHQFQGVDGTDTDIPTPTEIKLFSSTLGKLIWVFIQPGFYALRPMWIKPMAPNKDEIFNGLLQLTFNVFIYNFFGGKALAYLIVGTLLGLGLHPISGHFIAEHYQFAKGQETYSYYGPLNWITFNVGYHNEHHDFPRISWTKLPQLRKIAPEFYDNLKSYDSWVAVIYNFITDPNIGPYSRIKRKQTKIE